MGRFSTQTAVVVGAADGIGRATAELLAREGANVVCMDRNSQGCSEVAERLKTDGAKATAVEMDVTRDDSVRSAFRYARDEFGQIHVVVNCAGITGTTNIKSHEVEVDEFDFVCRVNLRGAFLVSKVALPAMVEHSYGRLLHVASIAGKEGNAGMVAYSATKAGMIGLVKTQGKEYAGTGITVNALAPAVIRTAMVAALPDEQVEYMTSRIPMGRCGTLDEAAEMIAWIVSPACSYTTGFTFDLSGGRAVY